MNILLLNRSGEIAMPLEHLLTRRGHAVFRVFSVCEAMDKLESNDVDCIVSGLGVEPDCLTDEEREIAGYTLAGWVWLKNYVLNDNPKMTNRIIIFSGHIEDTLMDIASEEELERVYLVSWQKEGWIDVLLESLGLIEKSIREHTKAELEEE